MINQVSRKSLSSKSGENLPGPVENALDALLEPLAVRLLPSHNELALR